MSVRRALPRLLAFTLLAAFAAGCGSDGSGSTTAARAPDSALVGTQWVLEGSAVTSWLRFAPAQVTGNDGCNQFTGAYQHSGSSLSFGPLAGTRKACPGAAGDVATRVSSALERVATYAISGTTLRLAAQSGDVLLTYRARAASVAGGWEATSVLYNDGIHSIVIGTTLTADFAAGGTVSGSGGCNTFTGPYTSDGDHVRIGPLAATQRACAGPEGANEQELGYFAALESARTIEQVGDELTLLNAKGQRAVSFTRAG